MSKIYESYKIFKEENPETLAIYKIGIFYVLIDADAKLISDITGLKLTQLNPDIVKCGFPIVSLPKYTNILNHKNIKYKILENKDKYKKIDDEENYINNIIVESIIEKIKNIDIYSITPRQALNIIEDFQEELNGTTITK